MWRVILIDSGENWSRDRYGKGCHSLWLDTTDSVCGYVFSTRVQDGVADSPGYTQSTPRPAYWKYVYYQLGLC